MSPLLSVQQLSIEFVGAQKTQPPQSVIQQVSFELYPGEILGLVGESGSGKSLTCLALLGLLPTQARVAGGDFIFSPKNQPATSLAQHGPKAWAKLRGTHIAYIPQDPMTALNPVYSVGDQLVEVIRYHQRCSQKEAVTRALALLDQVQIPSAQQRFHDYPHQFSGGMRQRALIAMALCCNPLILLADEPTTALDVTVQGQILELLQRLQQETGLAVLFITHDLGIVQHLCQRVMVMYAGQVIESASSKALFRQTAHPYTQGLLQSLPQLNHPPNQPLQAITGQPPTLRQLQQLSGCAFAPRCAQAVLSPVACTDNPPVLAEVAEQHYAACWLHQPVL